MQAYAILFREILKIRQFFHIVSIRLFLIVLTHILDKQINKPFREEGMRDDFGEGGLRFGFDFCFGSFGCFFGLRYLLLAEIHLRAQTLRGVLI